jgi:hypothetical protein
MSLFGANAAATSSTEPGDIELVNPPTDSISALAFWAAPQSDYLATGSWDNSVRLLPRIYGSK